MRWGVGGRLSPSTTSSVSPRRATATLCHQVTSSGASQALGDAAGYPARGGARSASAETRTAWQKRPHITAAEPPRLLPWA